MTLPLRTCVCGHKNTAHAEIVPPTEWEETWDGCLFCSCERFDDVKKARSGVFPAINNVVRGSHRRRPKQPLDPQ